jgi:hypothetical protein
MNPGQTVIWFRWDKERRELDRVNVKVVRVARNGVWIALPLDNGTTKKLRVSRDSLRYPKPPPCPRTQSPVGRPFAPPDAPPRRLFVKHDFERLTLSIYSFGSVDKILTVAGPR